MGFYSYKTADTKESIANQHSVRELRPVYLLQPGGKPPIEEQVYDGYGVFGGVNAMNWLAEANAEALGYDTSKLSEQETFLLGVSLDCGHVCEDTQTGEFWHIFSDARSLVPGHFVAKRFDEVIPELGDSANNLMESGRLVHRDIADVVGVPYPLKFSFDKNAVYEDLPASERCPDQGFFYED
ncbi:hypothetical protein [Marinobacter salicampi]|uniref:hypothetical protein n=1 Tax=Marinobacter salicampi TaxID=435907 RepID=UPI001407AF56|nr:hypothetical protein [Marinobacter salicampi]